MCNPLTPITIHAKPAPGSQPRQELVDALAQLDHQAKAIAGQAIRLRLSSRDPLWVLADILQEHTNAALILAANFVENEKGGNHA